MSDKISYIKFSEDESEDESKYIEEITYKPKS